MRILIADDSEIVRRGVRGLLSSVTEWEVCGEATNGAETLRKSRELMPDVVLLDVSMPGMSGLEVARVLRQGMPKATILFMSNHDPRRLSRSALEAGAHGCLDKGCLATDLLPTIRNFERLVEAHQLGDAGTMET